MVGDGDGKKSLSSTKLTDHERHVTVVSFKHDVIESWFDKFTVKVNSMLIVDQVIGLSRLTFESSSEETQLNVSFDMIKEMRLQMCSFDPKVSQLFFALNSDFAKTVEFLFDLEYTSGE